MEHKTILAVDCGTQSLRAILFSPKGDLLARVQQGYFPYTSPGPGLAEQDPQIYWDSLVTALKELKEKYQDLFASISGVGVTTQRNTMINVDREGKVLRPAITWLDQRRAKPCFGESGVLSMGLKLLGLERKVLDVQAQGKCNWIMQNQPGIWENTHKYLQVSGFLNQRLTGVFKDSSASQIGHLPFDFKAGTWATGFSLARKLFPVPAEKLPELVAPGEIIGEISREASEKTGLKQGLPVIACGSDKGCETLGAGVTDETMAALSFGTSATVQTTTPAYYETLALMPPYPSPVPGRYNPEIEIFRGFWMIAWFKQEFAYEEVEEAEKLGVPVEEILNRCLERTEPGAMGLLVQPYWGPGLDLPDAKGAMIGFGDVHTKDHIYRAVIEGLGFAMLEGLEKIQAKGGVVKTSAAVSGGASQSDEICQIMADIFNLPMVRGQTHETSGLGAAIVTARGLGIYKTIGEAVGNMVHASRVFQPEAGNVRIYRRLYREVYKHLYPTLSPLYARIREITGYPES
ncbi:FGGY-family carbohydrate kinase [Desulfospira joergensenii]|uniref:FGGY-family carbohydrate kinase n=1 Tax=Desulfospira joergensenii TaxID=53329 RepID=UPI0003B65B9D|nr:FGGY-family carbohydrate kinase [Desulfospira joergensenii]